ncbi:hypothetical protein HK099_006315 [Clydaea vesicula]|uniref:Uncharacterized protein n=1 Tax=Clydaea vesicula TaxID=447962 RepID=A0AAD5XZ60_9FUNG|nr:hypothetical protein HK099_006315 [Clydaea vesicula]
MTTDQDANTNSFINYEFDEFDDDNFEFDAECEKMLDEIEKTHLQLSNKDENQEVMDGELQFQNQHTINSSLVPSNTYPFKQPFSQNSSCSISRTPRYGTVTKIANNKFTYNNVVENSNEPNPLSLLKILKEENDVLKTQNKNKDGEITIVRINLDKKDKEIENLKLKVQQKVEENITSQISLNYDKEKYETEFEKLKSSLKFSENERKKLEQKILRQKKTAENIELNDKSSHISSIKRNFDKSNLNQTKPLKLQPTSNIRFNTIKNFGSTSHISGSNKRKAEQNILEPLVKQHQTLDCIVTRNQFEDNNGIEKKTYKDEGCQVNFIISEQSEINDDTINCDNFDNTTSCDVSEETFNDNMNGANTKNTLDSDASKKNNVNEATISETNSSTVRLEYLNDSGFSDVTEIR